MKIYKMVASLNKKWCLEKIHCYHGTIHHDDFAHKNPIVPPDYFKNRKVKDVLAGQTWPKGWKPYNPDLYGIMDKD